MVHSFMCHCIHLFQNTNNIEPTAAKRGMLFGVIYINIQKTKIMASGPITSWEIDGETVETVSDSIFGGLQNHCRW